MSIEIQSQALSSLQEALHAPNHQLHSKNLYNPYHGNFCRRICSRIELDYRQSHSRFLIITGDIDYSSLTCLVSTALLLRQLQLTCELTLFRYFRQAYHKIILLSSYQIQISHRTLYHMLSAWHDPTKLHKSLCSRTHVRPTYLFLLLQTSHELERLTGPFEWETKFKISNGINEIIHCVRSRDILIQLKFN